MTTTDVAEVVAPAGPPARNRVVGILARWRIGGGFFLVYLLLGLLYLHQLLPHFATATVGGGGGDGALFLSWLKWDQFSIWHGKYPLFNPYLQAPYGVSAVWNTSVLALGVILSPITALFGPTVTWNLLYLLAPALNCWTASKWLRRHVRPTSAFVGGLMFGFSPFVILHLRGHLHLFFLALVPLIVMLVEDLLARKARPLWPTAPLLGLLCFVQYLISSEVLLILALTLAPLVVVAALLFWRQTRERFVRVLVAGVLAGAVAAALLALPLLEQFSPGVAMTQPIFDAGTFEYHPSQLVSPSVLFWLHLAGGGTGDPHTGENAVYIGWPLVVVLPVIVVLLRRRKMVVLAFLAVAFAVTSEVDLRWSPFNLIRRVVPVADNIAASRFALMFALAAAFLVAQGLQATLDWMRRGPQRPAVGQRRRWIGAGAVVVTVAALVPWISDRPPIVFAIPPSPAFFTNGELQRTIPENSIVLLAPMADFSQNSGMQIQVESNFWFRQLGGYSLNNSGDGTPSFRPRESNLLSIFGIVAGHLRLNIRTDMWLEARQELANSQAAFLVVTPDPPHGRWTDEEVRRATRLTGRPADKQFGDVWIWNLREDCGTDPTIGALCPP